MSVFTAALRLWRAGAAMIEEGLASLPALAALAQSWRVAGAQAPDSQIEGRAPLVVRLRPEDGAFERAIVLPGAAARDLDQALALNLERWSPFAPEDTLAAVAPGSLRNEGQGLRFTLALASKTRLARLEEALRERGAAGPIAFDAAEAGAPVRYDLLTGVRPRARPLSAGDALLGLCVAGLIAGAAAAALMVQAGPDPTGGRQPADAASLADAAKRQTPSLVTAINALSEALPDTAHLNTLRFDTQGVTASGVASDAGALPARAEATGRFSGARIDGAVEADAGGREGFELVASHAGPGRTP